MKQKPVVKFFRMSKDAMPPHREHDSDACFDLFANIDIEIMPMQTINIGTGIKFEIPVGYEGVIRPRSGMSAKTGLRIANSPGTIDSGYRGEIVIIMTNIDKQEIYEIRKGMRIAQIGFREVPEIILTEVKDAKDLSDSDRGDAGLGSSGA